MKALFTALVLGVTAAATIPAAPAAAASPLETRQFRFVEKETGYRVIGRRGVNGTLHLRGTHPETGETFKLAVSDAGHVTGRFEGRSVDYVLNEDTETLIAANIR